MYTLFKQQDAQTQVSEATHAERNAFYAFNQVVLTRYNTVVILGRAPGVCNECRPLMKCSARFRQFVNVGINTSICPIANSNFNVGKEERLLTVRVFGGINCRIVFTPAPETVKCLELAVGCFQIREALKDIVEFCTAPIKLGKVNGGIDFGNQ